MQAQKNKYGVVLVIAVILCSCFFYSAQAQDEHGTTDTAVIVNPTTDDGTNANTGDQQKYFLEKSRSGEKYDSVRFRKVPDSLVNHLKKDGDFWYANYEPKGKKKESSSSIFGRAWFRTFLWVLVIIGFGFFLVWWLAGSNVGIFRKKNLLIGAAEGEAGTEDIFAINYQAEIEKAAGAGNYRLAIRLMFLRLLKDLSEKNIIQYKQERTNLDYLLQMQPTRYYSEFFRITRNYEYSWYGQFEVNPEIYNLIRQDFDNFNRRF